MGKKFSNYVWNVHLVIIIFTTHCGFRILARYFSSYLYSWRQATNFFVLISLTPSIAASLHLNCGLPIRSSLNLFVVRDSFDNTLLSFCRRQINPTLYLLSYETCYVFQGKISSCKPSTQHGIPGTLLSRLHSLAECPRLGDALSPSDFPTEICWYISDFLFWDFIDFFIRRDKCLRTTDRWVLADFAYEYADFLYVGKQISPSTVTNLDIYKYFTIISILRGNNG